MNEQQKEPVQKYFAARPLLNIQSILSLQSELGSNDTQPKQNQIQNLIQKQLQEIKADVQINKELKEIQSIPKQSLSALQSFTGIKADQHLQQTLINYNISIPTDFQKYVLPILFKRQSLLAIGPTGQGKSLGALIFASCCPSTDRISYLIHSQQLFNQIIAYCEQIIPDSFCTHMNYNPQKKLFLTTLSHYLVYKSSHKNSVLIVDECDMLTDQGFQSQFKKALDICKAQQFLFISATSCIQSIKFVQDYIKYQLIVQNNYPLSKNVKIEFQLVEQNQKDQGLINLVAKASGLTNTIIFTNSNLQIADVSSILQKADISFTYLSADNQEHHAQIIQSFNKTKNNIIVLSSSYARGVDFYNSDLVVLFNFPLTVEDFVHKSGRTGRGFRTGRVISLLEYIGDLQQNIKSVQFPFLTSIQQVVEKLQLKDLNPALSYHLDVLQIKQRLGLEHKQIQMVQMGRSAKITEVIGITPYFADAYSIFKTSRERCNTLYDYFDLRQNEAINTIQQLGLGQKALRSYYDVKILNCTGQFLLKTDVQKINELFGCTLQFLENNVIRIHGGIYDVFRTFEFMQNMNE
ncbi:Eukaryotic_translation initiation factor 4A [Hexamita inflata]|uniref:Eukaryotic translation initiation factor 4A n=1 Tax=Hexamita inflata TaxID=28002 RepID=A0AA86TU82_9EUKA|nr:Eukaryotic translation initiation factor 4A [Hexamita inflata]